jgi:hypothetical protein
MNRLLLTTFAKRKQPLIALPLLRKYSTLQVGPTNTKNLLQKADAKENMKRIWKKYVEIGEYHSSFFFATASILAFTAIFLPEWLADGDLKYMFASIVIGIASTYCWPFVWLSVIIIAIKKIFY